MITFLFRTSTGAEFTGRYNAARLRVSNMLSTMAAYDVVACEVVEYQPSAVL